MRKKEKRATSQDPQTLGNLAMASKSVEDLEEGEGTLRSSRLKLIQNVAQKELDEEVEVDQLAPVKGILNGLLLSIAIWCLIALGILLVMS